VDHLIMHAHRPGRAVQRATLDIAAAVLTGNDEAAITAAATVPCPVCLALSITSYWINAVAALGGDRGAGLVTASTRARLLAFTHDAQAGLDSREN
jgi:hypothetical protein